MMLGSTSGVDLAFAWGAARGGLRAGGADAVEEDGGGFVVGVLGDEFAFEGFVEDGLAEAGGADGCLVDLAAQVGD
jgi:hypothetical protein